MKKLLVLLIVFNCLVASAQPLRDDLIVNIYWKNKDGKTIRTFKKVTKVTIEGSCVQFTHGKNFYHCCSDFVVEVEDSE